MQESIAKESPTQAHARRIGAAGMALAAVLTLGACRATGGGYSMSPYPAGQGDSAFTGPGKLRLQLHLRGDTAKKRP